MFDQALLKLNRANDHATAFNQLVEQFSQSHWFELSAHNDVLRGSATLVLKMIDEPPSNELALILGDALHNLRAALDVAFYELVQRLNREPTEHTQFPVRKKYDDLARLLSKGSIAGDADAHTCILDKIRPYCGGDDLLVALHALDIRDKHCLMIPTVNVGGVDGIHADLTRKIGTISIRDVGMAGVINKEQPLKLLASEDARIDLRRYGAPSLYMTFGKATPLEGRPIRQTINAIAERVRHAIECFRELLNARTPGTAEYAATRPIPAGHHKRTSPCPCGSGLKYKKCHGPHTEGAKHQP